MAPVLISIDYIQHIILCHIFLIHDATEIIFFLYLSHENYCEMHMAVICFQFANTLKRSLFYFKEIHNYDYGFIECPIFGKFLIFVRKVPNDQDRKRIHFKIKESLSVNGDLTSRSIQFEKKSLYHNICNIPTFVYQMTVV